MQLIYTETEGVPLFVEEVYRHLPRSTASRMRRGKWLPQVEIGEIEVPETVRLVLGRRIDRISETAQRIMTTASCIGRAFTFEFLTALAEETEEDLLDALEEAERARLVLAEEGRQPRFVFAHEQIRQTLLGRLSFVRRQRLHRRVADTLERLHAGHLDEHVERTCLPPGAGGGPGAGGEVPAPGRDVGDARLATPEALALFAKAAELAGPGVRPGGPRCVREANCCSGLFRGSRGHRRSGAGDARGRGGRARSPRRWRHSCGSGEPTTLWAWITVRR